MKSERVEHKAEHKEVTTLEKANLSFQEQEYLQAFDLFKDAMDEIDNPKNLSLALEYVCQPGILPPTVGIYCSQAEMLVASGFYLSAYKLYECVMKETALLDKFFLAKQTIDKIFARANELMNIVQDQQKKPFNIFVNLEYLPIKHFIDDLFYEIKIENNKLIITGEGSHPLKLHLDEEVLFHAIEINAPDAEVSIHDVLSAPNLTEIFVTATNLTLATKITANKLSLIKVSEGEFVLPEHTAITSKSKFNIKAITSTIAGQIHIPTQKLQVNGVEVKLHKGSVINAEATNIQSQFLQGDSLIASGELNLNIEYETNISQRSKIKAGKLSIKTPKLVVNKKSSCEAQEEFELDAEIVFNYGKIKAKTIGITAGAFEHPIGALLEAEQKIRLTVTDEDLWLRGNLQTPKKYDAWIGKHVESRYGEIVIQVNGELVRGVTELSQFTKLQSIKTGILDITARNQVRIGSLTDASIHFNYGLSHIGFFNVNAVTSSVDSSLFAFQLLNLNVTSIDEIKNTIQHILNKDFKALSTELQEKVTHHNVIAFCYWLIKKIFPELNSIIDTLRSIALLFSNEDFKRSWVSLYNDFMQGIKVEPYRIWRLLSLTKNAINVGLFIAESAHALAESAHSLNENLHETDVGTLFSGLSQQIWEDVKSIDIGPLDAAAFAATLVGSSRSEDHLFSFDHMNLNAHMSESRQNAFMSHGDVTLALNMSEMAYRGHVSGLTVAKDVSFNGEELDVEVHVHAESLTEHAERLNVKKEKVDANEVVISAPHLKIDKTTEVKTEDILLQTNGLDIDAFVHGKGKFENIHSGTYRAELKKPIHVTTPVVRPDAVISLMTSSPEGIVVSAPMETAGNQLIATAGPIEAKASMSGEKGNILLGAQGVKIGAPLASVVEEKNCQTARFDSHPKIQLRSAQDDNRVESSEGSVTVKNVDFNSKGNTVIHAKLDVKIDGEKVQKEFTFSGGADKTVCLLPEALVGQPLKKSEILQEYSTLHAEGCVQIISDKKSVAISDSAISGSKVSLRAAEAINMLNSTSMNAASAMPASVQTSHTETAVLNEAKHANSSSIEKPPHPVHEEAHALEFIHVLGEKSSKEECAHLDRADIAAITASPLQSQRISGLKKSAFRVDESDDESSDEEEYEKEHKEGSGSHLSLSARRYSLFNHVRHEAKRSAPIQSQIHPVQHEAKRSAPVQSQAEPVSIPRQISNKLEIHDLEPAIESVPLYNASGRFWQYRSDSLESKLAEPVIWACSIRR